MRSFGGEFDTVLIVYYLPAIVVPPIGAMVLPRVALDRDTRQVHLLADPADRLALGVTPADFLEPLLLARRRLP